MIFHTNKIKSYLIQKYEMNSKNHMGKLISRVLWEREISANCKQNCFPLLFFFLNLEAIVCVSYPIDLGCEGLYVID